MFKKIFFLSFFVFQLIFSQKNNLLFMTPKGIPSIVVKKLSETSTFSNNTISYTIEENPTNLITSIMKKKADIAIVPSNVIKNITDKNLPYTIIGTVGEGSFYLLGYDNITEYSDLNNTPLGINGKGMTPDILAQHILKNRGLTTANLQYYPSATDTAFMLLNKKIHYAIIPEPLVSLVLAKNSDIKILMDLNKEWKNMEKTNFGYPQSTLIIKTELLKTQPNFVEKFLKQYQNSLIFLLKNPNSSIYNEYNLSKNSIHRFNVLPNFPSKENNLKEYNLFFKTIGREEINEKHFK